MSRPSPYLIPLLTVLFAAVAALWWLPNRPADIATRTVRVAVDTRFNSVSFAPFRAGQSPLADRFPSAAEVEADMAVVAPRVRAIRTYAALEGQYDVAAMAQRHGLKLWQGIWLGADRAQNAREIAAGIAAANRYPDTVERVVVGNEVLLRRDLPPAELAAAIDAVRAAVRQPVTYADVWEFWDQFPEIAAHVDVVTIHLLPYWEDQPIGIDARDPGAGAVAHVGAVYRRMAARFAPKPVAIGETGWPSRGRWREAAAPSVVNQAAFLRAFVELARSERFDYNLIEAFDQLWKYQSEGVVGANWGIWTADREPKFPQAGPVVENAGWPVGAVASVAVAMLLLGMGLAAAPAPPWSGQAALATLATALGAALAYAAVSVAPDLYDVRLRIAAAGNLAGQGALAMLLMLRVAASLEGGGPCRPARTGADATRSVRALARLRLPPVAAWFDDLSFVFVWTAAVLQLLLLFDPRYREFPLPVFAVPVVATVSRALLRDLPGQGGGREELLAGGALAAGAVASLLREGLANRQAAAWTISALILAMPPLLRVLRPARVAGLWRCSPG